MKTPAAGFSWAFVVLMAGHGTCPAQDRPPAPAATAEPVTYSKHIAPIFQQRCVECHRPGEIGPFSLLTCDDVRKHLLTCGNTFHSFSLSPGVVRYLAD